MSVQKFRLYGFLHLFVVLLTLGALLLNPFTSAITLAEENPFSPGLSAAIEEAMGPEAYAQFIEDAKLTASDAAADDSFGHAVAISGDTALVGAHVDDSLQGSAYIFERNQGGVDTWGQVAKLTASDGVGGDQFGYSIALSGDTALVGAYLDDDGGSASGSAYIFERDQGGADNWGEVAKLTASDGAADDYFGYCVSVSGNTALVGSLFNDDGGNASGSAYIFERDQGGADNWGQLKKLTASDGAALDLFGNAVALSGDTALVAAYYDDDNGPDSGSAYIFERDQGGTDNWGEAKKLTASDGSTYDYFGFSVALSGDTALVSADEDDDEGSASGSAYLIERDQGGAGNWGEVKKLTASDGAAYDYFGEFIALSGDTALVGAPYDDDNGASSGSAYVFQRNQGGIGNWGEAAKLTASDGAADDYFGLSVAISGDTVLVGANNDDDDGANSGSAYIYTPYLANGSFEDPLGAEWTEVVSANGDGRVPLNQAYEGSYIYLFKADGGLEIIRQTVAASGIAGDEYTLTLYFGGKDVDLSGNLGARLMFKNGGVKVDKKICIFTPPSSSFFWSSFTCTLTATGAFDNIEVIIGIQNVTGGMVGVDAAILNKTGP